MTDSARFEGTIAAIATPPGMGGVGVLRVSGPDAFAVARRLAPGLPEAALPRRLYLSDLFDPQTGEQLDRALVVLMPAPHSFTGEDVAELQCHGGTVHLRQLLDAVLAAGARPAEAGEFTRRAFLNGQLDLLQAEALGDLVEARSEAACRLARRHLEGGLSRRVGALRDALVDALTLLEAGLDFSLEEHVVAIDPEDLGQRLDSALDAIDELLASYARGRRLREGIRCVIAGRPNAGKSTLLNRLLDDDRAIVAAEPGTTRDYLDADFVLDGFLFTLVDTAGLRPTSEPVEAEGVRRSKAQLADADLVLFVADATLAFEEAERAEIGALAAPGLLVWNKLDRAGAGVPPALPPHWLGVQAVSLLQDARLDGLLDALRGAATRLAGTAAADSATLTRARQRDALTTAREHLRVALEATREGLDSELIAVDLRLGLDAVGAIVGAVTPEDILNRIFASFCVGK